MLHFPLLFLRSTCASSVPDEWTITPAHLSLTILLPVMVNVSAIWSEAASTALICSSGL